MFDDNVCIFVPYHGDYQSVHTVNFVLETKAQSERVFRTEALYKAHYVLCGSGFLHTMGATRRLERGDVFSLLPERRTLSKAIRASSTLTSVFSARAQI